MQLKHNVKIPALAFAAVTAGSAMAVPNQNYFSYNVNLSCNIVADEFRLDYGQISNFNTIRNASSPQFPTIGIGSFGPGSRVTFSGGSVGFPGSGQFYTSIDVGQSSAASYAWYDSVNNLSCAGGLGGNTWTPLPDNFLNHSFHNIGGGGGELFIVRKVTRFLGNLEMQQLDYGGGLWESGVLIDASPIRVAPGEVVDFDFGQMKDGEWGVMMISMSHTQDGPAFAHTMTAGVVPEPASLIALSAGVATLIARRRARK
ncbi:MAG: hypothetical protein HONBIEJF_00203 [Fimbriimonadaceae bacterium]|nr:hypothetical protein [Fimbriimonadaceae bacterium]